MRCVTLPPWLTRGIFSSVGWLPFLNCASALAAKKPSPANPAQRPRTHFHMLRITAPSSLVVTTWRARRNPRRDTPVLEGRPRGSSVSSEGEERSHECWRISRIQEKFRRTYVGHKRQTLHTRNAGQVRSAATGKSIAQPERKRAP